MCENKIYFKISGEYKVVPIARSGQERSREGKN